MRKKLSLAVVALAVSCVAVAVYAARPKQAPTFEIFANHIVSTTADPGIVAAARHQMHETMARWVLTDGKRSDPSFGEVSQSWTTTTRADKTLTASVGRSTTEFTAADGKPVKLEVIAGTDMPTVVFVSYSGEGGPSKVVNAFVASLQQQGVQLKDQ